jgi:hypothetical protein
LLTVHFIFIPGGSVIDIARLQNSEHLVFTVRINPGDPWYLPEEREQMSLQTGTKGADYYSAHSMKVYPVPGWRLPGRSTWNRIIAIRNSRSERAPPSELGQSDSAESSLWWRIERKIHNNIQKNQILKRILKIMKTAYPVPQKLPLLFFYSFLYSKKNVSC